jgi:c-di-AMP phosphodiesterase-like protein
MNENIELSKVRILENHLQGNINAMHSMVLGLYVSISVLLLSLSLQFMNLVLQIMIALFATIVFLLVLLFRVKQYQKRNLTYIDELLKKIENGEPLPSIIELEKEVSKRPL